MEKKFFLRMECQNSWAIDSFDTIEEALNYARKHFEYLCYLSENGNHDAVNYVKEGASYHVYDFDMDLEEDDERVDFDPVDSISCEELWNDYWERKHAEEEEEN